MHHSFLSISLLCLICMSTITNACASSRSTLEDAVCNEDSIDDEMTTTEWFIEEVTDSLTTTTEQTSPITAPLICTTELPTTSTTVPPTTSTTVPPTTSTTVPPTTSTTVPPTTSTTVPPTTSMNCKNEPCGDGFEEHHGKCYKFVPASPTDPLASDKLDHFKTECTNQKSRLAFFYDQTTVEFFVDLVRRGREEARIAISFNSTNDDDDDVLKGTVVVGILGDREREFLFDDGTGIPVDVLQWAAFQPRSTLKWRGSRVTMAVGIDHIKDGHLLVWSDDSLFTGALCERAHPTCPDEDLESVRPRCNVPPEGEGRCEDGWELHVESATCYRHLQFKGENFEGCERRCNKLGAHLPTVHFESQGYDITRHMGTSFSYWIGARSDPNNPLRFDRYMDESAIDYGNWKPTGQVEYASNGTERMCLYEEMIDRNKFKYAWRMGSCRDLRGPNAICAKPAEGVVFKPPGCVFLGKVMP